MIEYTHHGRPLKDGDMLWHIPTQEWGEFKCLTNYYYGTSQTDIREELLQLSPDDYVWEKPDDGVMSSPFSLVSSLSRASEESQKRIDVSIANKFEEKDTKVSKANDRQVGGDHYRKKKIQLWDFIAENEIGFFEATAMRYLTRWKDKNGIEDLEKAKHYIEKLIEVETEKAQPK